MNLTRNRNQESQPQINALTDALDDVRQTLRHEADNLAQVAAQLGREAGRGAAKVSHDVGPQAASVARDASTIARATAHQLLRGAGLLSGKIATTGKQGVRELSQVRLTKAPARRGSKPIPGITLLGGLGAGIALMYFFDPADGQNRRALLRGRLSKWTSMGRTTATEKATELRQKAGNVSVTDMRAMAADKATELRNRTIEAVHEARRVVGIPVGEQPAEAEETEAETSESEQTQEAHIA